MSDLVKTPEDRFSRFIANALPSRNQIAGTYILCETSPKPIAVKAIKSVDYIPGLIKTQDINGFKSSSEILVKSRKITGDSML